MASMASLVNRHVSLTSHVKYSAVPQSPLQPMRVGFIRPSAISQCRGVSPRILPVHTSLAGQQYRATVVARSAAGGGNAASSITGDVHEPAAAGAGGAPPQGPGGRGGDSGDSDGDSWQFPHPPEGWHSWSEVMRLAIVALGFALALLFPLTKAAGSWTGDGKPAKANSAGGEHKSLLDRMKGFWTSVVMALPIITDMPPSEMGGHDFGAETTNDGFTNANKGNLLQPQGNVEPGAGHGRRKYYAAAGIMLGVSLIVLSYWLDHRARQGKGTQKPVVPSRGAMDTQKITQEPSGAVAASKAVAGRAVAAKPGQNGAVADKDVEMDEAEKHSATKPWSYFHFRFWK